MSWDTQAPLILRYLINDVDSPQTFSDSRLQTACLVGAQFLIAEIDYFNQTYQVDVLNTGLTPDPISGADNAFFNLMVLRANVIVTEGQYRKAMQSAGYVVKDGPSQVDTRGVVAGYKVAMEKAAKDYADARWEFEAGVQEPGRCVLAPFSSPTLDFRGSRYYDPRDREWL